VEQGERVKPSPFEYLVERFDPAAAVLIDSLINTPTTLDLVLFLTSNPAIVATPEDWARYLGRPVADVRESLAHLVEQGYMDVLPARRQLSMLTRNSWRRHELLWLATQLADPRAQRDVRKWLCLQSLEVVEGGAQRAYLQVVTGCRPDPELEPEPPPAR
jgi:hypothetical protein